MPNIQIPRRRTKRRLPVLLFHSNNLSLLGGFSFFFVIGTILTVEGRYGGGYCRRHDRVGTTLQLPVSTTTTTTIRNTNCQIWKWTHIPRGGGRGYSGDDGDEFDHASDWGSTRYGPRASMQPTSSKTMHNNHDDSDRSKYDAGRHDPQPPFHQDAYRHSDSDDDDQHDDDADPSTADFTIHTRDAMFHMQSPLDSRTTTTSSSLPQPQQRQEWHPLIQIPCGIGLATSGVEPNGRIHPYHYQRDNLDRHTKQRISNTVMASRDNNSISRHRSTITSGTSCSTNTSLLSSLSSSSSSSSWLSRPAGTKPKDSSVKKTSLSKRRHHQGDEETDHSSVDDDSIKNNLFHNQDEKEEEEDVIVPHRAYYQEEEESMIIPLRTVIDTGAQRTIMTWEAVQRIGFLRNHLDRRYAGGMVTGITGSSENILLGRIPAGIAVLNFGQGIGAVPSPAIYVLDSSPTTATAITGGSSSDSEIPAAKGFLGSFHRRHGRNNHQQQQQQQQHQSRQRDSDGGEEPSTVDLSSHTTTSSTSESIDLLLGLDFLRDYDAIVNLRDEELILRNPAYIKNSRRRIGRVLQEQGYHVNSKDECDKNDRITNKSHRDPDIFIPFIRPRDFLSPSSRFDISRPRKPRWQQRNGRNNSYDDIQDSDDDDDEDEDHRGLDMSGV